jgi:hypothetical protein
MIHQPPHVIEKVEKLDLDSNSLDVKNLFLIFFT